MTNKEILKENLSPQNKEDQSKWNKFLDSLDDTALWFPESESRFSMLNWFAGGENEHYPIPSLYIYTDHLPHERLFYLINGDTLDFEDHRVYVKDNVPVEAKWDYTLNYDYLHPLHKSAMSQLYGDGKYEFVQSEPTTNAERILKPVDDDDFLQKMNRINGRDMIEKIYLFRITIEFDHDTLEDEPDKSSIDTYLLFFCHEQVAFFKKFVVEEGLSITYLVTMNRATRNYLTGRAFEHVLGYMGIKYLITRLEKIREQVVYAFLNDQEIRQLIEHPDNKRYILDELIGYDIYDTIFRVNYTN